MPLFLLNVTSKHKDVFTKLKKNVIQEYRCLQMTESGWTSELI